MKANEDFKVTKIPLEMFINLLVILYEEGANFIDLSAQVDKDEETDTIKIGVREDYYDDEEEEEDDDDVQPAKIIKLSDDDINDLI
jgi:hypothetical protein